MTKSEALQKLEELNNGGDEEYNHIEADQVLLDLINDPEIEKAFDAIKKWYA